MEPRQIIHEMRNFVSCETIPTKEDYMKWQDSERKRIQRENASPEQKQKQRERRAELKKAMTAEQIDQEKAEMREYMKRKRELVSPEKMKEKPKRRKA